MNDEKELERHKKIVEQIKNADNKDELPNISFSSIATFLASNVYFDKRKLSQSEFKPVVDGLISYGAMYHPVVQKAFMEVLKDNYPEVSEEEIIKKYMTVASAKRIRYILEEVGLKNEKLHEILQRENLEIHKEIMSQIGRAFEVKDLPKVGLGELNAKLLKAVNGNSFKKFKTSEIKDITSVYLYRKGYEELQNAVENIATSEGLNADDEDIMYMQILSSLLSDETIEYTVEEIYEKEKRKLFIYKNDHELIMDQIKDAKRISQLPRDLSISTLTGYLNGNTTIYPNDDRINTDDLKLLVALLLSSHKWEDEVVIEELKDIAESKYPEKNDAFDLLYKKLSALPRTYYLVEEINYSLERQKEFIINRSSNVNLYLIPNDKSPIEGGRFYNCYINRAQKLDLEEILPLDLNSIVPPSMDLDSIEWYVQENYDETFKKVGGIILNKDETIGNVSEFRPNDGKIGVTLDEKKKMDEISDLDVSITDKQEELRALKEELDAKRKESSEAELKMRSIIKKYKGRVLSLTRDLSKEISDLESEYALTDDE